MGKCQGQGRRLVSGIVFERTRSFERVCASGHGERGGDVRARPGIRSTWLKDKRNKRHVGSIRPAFDRFPGRITASYNAFYVNLAARTAQVCRFFSGRPEKISVVGGSNGEKGTHLSCASIGGDYSKAKGSS